MWSLALYSAKTVALATQATLNSLLTDTLAQQQNMARGVRAKTVATASTHISDKARHEGKARGEKSDAAQPRVITTDAVVAVLTDKGYNVVVPSTVPMDGVRGKGGGYGGSGAK